MLNFNIAPYFDDTVPESDYYRILFTPGKPVQTRELNALQSILQQQVRSHGDHIFKNGSMVIPGHIFYDNVVYYGRLQSTHNGVNADVLLESFVGVTVLGQTSGVKAKVIHYELSGTGDPPTIFFKYLESGTNDTSFIDGEVLIDVDSSQQIRLDSANSTGLGSIVTINDGIYYISGIFCRVARQTITLEKYSDRPTYRVGLNVLETLVTEKDDESLYDNALGYSNYAAPGAHRYKIELDLVKKSFETATTVETDADQFVELLQIKSGAIQKKVNETKYSEIEKMFAKRTYDESGDYEVVPFEITASEYRSNNRGAWATGSVYLLGDVCYSNGYYWEARSTGTAGATAPILSGTNYRVFDGGVTWQYTAAPYYNQGMNIPALDETLATQQFNESKMLYTIYPGKAYIRGFETELQSNAFAAASKAREYTHVKNNNVPVTAGTFTKVDTLSGLPNIDTCELVNIHYLDLGQTYGTLKRQATATYTVTTGAISVVTITDGGFGYDRDNPPTVTAAVGSGAVLKAIISTSSELVGIRVVNGGTGYSNGSFTISAPPASEPTIGTCRIRSIDHDTGTIGTSAAVYKLQVFDVRMKPGYRWDIHAMSLQQGTTYFSCNIVKTKTTLSGLVSVTSSATDVVGNGTYFINELYGGQHVLINGEHHFVSDTITSDLAFNTAHDFAASASSVPIEVYTSSFETYGNLLIPLPKAYMRTMRSDDDYTINTQYYVKRRIDIGVGSTANLTVPGETFANPEAYGAFVIARLDNGAIVDLAITRSSDNKQITVTRGGIVASLEIIATVKKSLVAAKEKVKTLKVKTIEIINKEQVEADEIPLTEADVINILSVKVSGDRTSLPIGGANYDAFDLVDSIDVTEKYQLLTGQTPTYYGMSKIRRLRGIKAPDNAIQITFEYYDHGVGDYFSIDSYVGVPYYKIQPELRDVIDVRPRIDDTGSNFNSDGSSVTEPFALDEDFVCDYSYFLPRRDKIVLSTDSAVIVEEGISGYGLQVNPNKDGTLVIAEVTLAPYTIQAKEPFVAIKKLEHKRYTMKDIGRLEQRIENLEYYTQLSLLEKNTIEQKILDQDGLERYKAGILVDQFTSLDGGDVLNTDHLCAIDMDQQECRAAAEVVNVPMIEKYTESTQKFNQHYQVSGNVVSLPYSSVMMTGQIVASAGSDGIISCNPYSVVIYKGSMELVPSEDNWMDTERLPNRTINIGSGTPGTTNLGTQWNSWQTTGSTTSTTSTALPSTTSTTSRTVGTNTIAGAIQTATSSTRTGFANPVWMTGSQIATTTTATRPITTETTTATTVATTTNRLVTSTTNTAQARTGTTTTATTSTSSSTEDRFQDIAFIPFIRSRPIVFKATGLKPNTLMYPFFDKVNVLDYCLPLEELVITYDFTGSVSGDDVLLPDALEDSEDEFADTPSRWVRRLNRGLTTEETTEFEQQVGERLELRRGRNKRPRNNTFRGFWHGPRRRRRNKDDRRDRRVRADRLFLDRRTENRTTIRTDWNDIRDEKDRPTSRRDRNRGAAQDVATTNVESFIYEEGDLIQQLDNGGNIIATAIVVEIIDQYDSNGNLEKIMKVTNRNGTFEVSNGTEKFVREETSGVSAKVLAFRGLDEVELRTNSVGTIIGEFLIPNREDIRFPIGTRKFFLTDDALNRPDFVKTASTAEAEYHALGISKMRQNVTTNVTTTSITQTPTSESRTLTSSSTNVQSNTTTATTLNTTRTTSIERLWQNTDLTTINSDPIAQTFRIPTDNTDPSAGAFITGLTVFFVSKPVENINVFCQIKNVENGYPGSTVYGQVTLTPSEVDVFPDTYIPIGEDHTGTTFKFESPIYLKPEVEYCVVVGSSSSDYYVRMARVGTQEFGKPAIVTQQPSSGSLFTSQNNSTWTADQTGDLTYILHRADFDITQNAAVVLTNKELIDKTLPANSLYAIQGSNVVRVYQVNHGFQVGDKVTLAKVLKGPFTSIIGDYLSMGYDANAVEADYIVTTKDYDYYTIEVKNSSGVAINAAYTGLFGGADATTTYHVQYSTLMPQFDILDFDATDYRINLRGTYGETSQTSENAPYSLTEYFPVYNNQNTHFIEPMLVASGDNEELYLGSEQSFEVTVNMSSFNTRLSPMLTLDRASVVCVRNKINSPTAENTNVSTIDDIVIFTGSESVTDGMFTFNWDEYDSNNHYLETTESVLYPGINKLKPGKYISLEAPPANDSVNVGLELLISKVVPTYDTSGNITKYRIYIDESTPFVDELITADKKVKVVLKDRFVHELAPEFGSALSTYVSSAMRLENASTGLRIMADCCVPLDTTLEVWYRTLLVNEATKLVDERWFQMQPIQRIVSTNDFQTFTEISWESSDLKMFDVCQAKIVFKSENNALSPRIKNFRMMALA